MIPEILLLNLNLNLFFYILSFRSRVVKLPFMVDGHELHHHPFHFSFGCRRSYFNPMDSSGDISRPDHLQDLSCFLVLVERSYNKRVASLCRVLSDTAEIVVLDRCEEFDHSCAQRRRGARLGVQGGWGKNQEKRKKRMLHRYEKINRG